MTRIPAGKLRLRLGARAGAEAHAQGKACGFPHTPHPKKVLRGEVQDRMPLRVRENVPDQETRGGWGRTGSCCQGKRGAAGTGWNPDAGRSGGDGRDMDLLVEEGLKNTEAFVALTGNSETNILACLAAKRMGVSKTVAEVENIDYIGMAESLDIGTVINKKMIAASHIYQMMLDADVSNVKCLTFANADVAEFTVKAGSKITKHPVKDLGLPKGTTIGGLIRQGEGVVVMGNTLIQPGDHVVVFCLNMMIKKIEKYFN